MDGILRSFPIRARLVLLAITLVAMLVGTSLFLDRTLMRALDGAREAARLAALSSAARGARDAFTQIRQIAAEAALGAPSLPGAETEATRGWLRAQLALLHAQGEAAAAAIGVGAARFDEMAGEMPSRLGQDHTAAGAALARLREGAAEAETRLAALQDDLAARSNVNRTRVIAGTEATVRAAELLTAAAVGLGALLTFLVLRSILVPLRRVGEALEGY